MFTSPKYNHRSSGIVSGLKHRQGYKVGGRVGLKHGGPHGNPMPAGFVGGANTGERIPTLVPSMSNQVSPTAEKIFLNNQSLRQKYYTPIDYSQFNRTPLDTLSKASTDFLNKRNQVIPAGTVGSSNQFLDATISLGDAQAETKTINQQNKLKQLSEENKMTLDLIDQAETQAEIFRVEGRASESNEITNSIEIKKLDLGYAQIEAQLEAAGIKGSAAKYAADRALEKMPSEMQTYKMLLDQGVNPEKAFATAFKLANSQTQFARTILEGYKSEILAGMRPAEALQETIKSMNILYPGSFNLNQEQLDSLEALAQDLDGSGGDGSNFD